MAQQPTQQYGTGGQQYGGQQYGEQQYGEQQPPYQESRPPYQEPQPQHQAGPTEQRGMGGGQSQQRGMDLKLEEDLTEEMRVVLHDLVQSATACEWCAERCIDEGPEMAECLRLCRDVADLATLNVRFIARDSVFGPEAIEVFAAAAEACAQECARHGHRHCQECAEQLSRAVQSTRKMLASLGQPPQQGQQPGMPSEGGMQSPPPSEQGQQFQRQPGQQSQQ